MTTFMHQCPNCSIVNTDTVLHEHLYCSQASCGWNPEKTQKQNEKTGTLMVLLTDAEIEAYHAAKAPVGPADYVRPRTKPQPLCTICQQPVPFPVHPSAPDGIDWRCSDACSLAAKP